MSFIVVMVELLPKEGEEDKLIPLAEALVEETLKEDGNIDYKFLKSNDGKFHIIEQWESIEALSEHMASSHFKFFHFLFCFYVFSLFDFICSLCFGLNILRNPHVCPNHRASSYGYSSKD